MRSVDNHLARALLMIVALTATACQDPVAPVDEPAPAPAPAPALRHNAVVVLRRIDIEGACDGKDLFGDPKKGQFQYRIRVRDNVVGSNVHRYTLESDDYGDLLGQTYLRGPGSSIDLGDRGYTIRALSESESVTVSLYGIEWDTIAKDRNMDGAGVSRTHRYSKDGRVYYELNLGSGGCRIELEYAIDWSTP